MAKRDSVSDLFEDRARLRESPKDYPLKISAPDKYKFREITKREADIFARRAQPTPEQVSPEQVSPEQTMSERGILASIGRGVKAGTIGLAVGYEPQLSPDEETFVEHLSAMTGKVLSDLPAMIGGGLLGAFAGPIGAGAGAFAAPTLINEAFREYRDSVKQGHDLSFGDYLVRSGRVIKETGKEAIVGGATGAVSKLLPFLRLIPAANKLLNKKLGRVAVTGALELGAMTGTRAKLEGEWPTRQEVIDNSLMLAGFKGAHLGAEKIGKVIPRSVHEKVSRLGQKISERIPEGVKKLHPRYWLEQTEQQKKFFKILHEHLGERNAKLMESQFKWRNALDKAEQKGKFTPENLKEMMYYRQKTGNPFKKGDSYAALEKRLPEHAKEFVDTVVDKHFKESLKAWNENPLTKDIKPREGLEDIYLPGLYKYDPKVFPRAYDEISRRFKAANPFKNQKTFMNYLDAFQEKGLEPRYKNISDLMRAYDTIMTKSMVNTELLDTIKKTEKEAGKKFIVRSTDRRIYNDAKKMGYVSFEDPFLRQYVTGTKDGKPVFGTTAAPALVHPDFASAFQGVFSRESFKSPTAMAKVGQYYDSINNLLRFSRVSLSPFHYGALMESAIGAKGTEAFAIRKWMNEGAELRKNKDFMVDAARSGLTVRPIEPEIYKKGMGLIDKAIDALPDKIGESKGVNLLRRGLGYLFEEFHPRLKLSTWKGYIDTEIAKRVKEGRPPSVEETKTIKRDMASLVNDLYGGQQWEALKVFNNPRTMRYLRRVIGYPDWTVSAIRQAANAFMPGLKGDVARRYWMKYGIAYLLGTGFLKFMNSGFYQSDPNKSIKGIRWSPEKAREGTLEGDPSKWYMFPLPDFDVNIAGSIFNPGRDKQGKKLYAHWGKQALEIGQWINHPFNELFSKSSPIITSVYKQIMDYTPYGAGYYPVRAGYKKGELVPWEGTKPGTAERFVSQAKELAGEWMPFSMRALTEKGVAPWIAAGLGMVPISKGMTLKKGPMSSIPYLERAFKEKDSKQVARIRRVLKDNAFSDRQIKSTISSVVNPLIRQAFKENNIKDLNKYRNILKNNGYSDKEINKKIKTLRK